VKWITNIRDSLIPRVVAVSGRPSGISGAEDVQELL